MEGVRDTALDVEWLILFDVVFEVDELALHELLRVFESCEGVIDAFEDRELALKMLELGNELREFLLVLKEVLL